MLPFNRENWQKAIEDGKYYPVYDNGCYALLCLFCDFLSWLNSMKIPLLPIHILTTKTLERKIEKARADTRESSNKQLLFLLRQNAKLRLGNTLSAKRQKKRVKS